MCGVLYRGGLTEAGVCCVYWCAVQGWTDRGWCVLCVLCVLVCCTMVDWWRLVCVVCIGVLYKGGLTEAGVCCVYCVLVCCTGVDWQRLVCVIYIVLHKAVLTEAGVSCTYHVWVCCARVDWHAGVCCMYCVYWCAVQGRTDRGSSVLYIQFLLVCSTSLDWERLVCLVVVCIDML